MSLGTKTKKQTEGLKKTEEDQLTGQEELGQRGKKTREEASKEIRQGRRTGILRSKRRLELAF